MFTYYTRRLSIAMVAKISCSVFCCLNLMIGVTKPEFRFPVASAAIKAGSESQYDRQPMPQLSGEQAETWLKQQGIYHSLQSSIDSSSYQMRWTDGAYR